MFIGDLTNTQGGQTSAVPFTATLTVGSPLNGTFTLGEDRPGTLSGEAEGNEATFTGTITGDCPGTLNGSMTLVNDTRLSFEGTGSDCGGALSLTGRLDRLAECVNIAGTWQVNEQATVTCVAEGESETVTLSDTGTVVITQNECDISYTVPNTQVTRQGSIDGSDVTIRGPLALSVEGVRFTENQVTFEGVVLSGDTTFTLRGTGVARGTVDGSTFSCTATSTAEFTR
jgi:hypothetical protein